MKVRISALALSRFEVCIDPSIFYRFLTVHYRDTYANGTEYLLEPDQSFLKIGSRHRDELSRYSDDQKFARVVADDVTSSNWILTDLPAGTKVFNTLQYL